MLISCLTTSLTNLEHTLYHCSLCVHNFAVIRKIKILLIKETNSFVSLLWCMLGSRMCWRCPTTVFFLFWGFISSLSLVLTSKLTACRSSSSVRAGNYLREYFLARPFSRSRSLPPNEVSQLTYWGHDEGCTLTPEGVAHFKAPCGEKKKYFLSYLGAVLYFMTNTHIFYFYTFGVDTTIRLSEWSGFAGSVGKDSAFSLPDKNL